MDTIKNIKVTNTPFQALSKKDDDGDMPSTNEPYSPPLNGDLLGNTDSVNLSGPGKREVTKF
ncbi:MAG: hypothetical protein ACLFQV_05310 [Vulcanimicrobiota bacterium]